LRFECDAKVACSGIRPKAERLGRIASGLQLEGFSCPRLV
jgi:hypothetical protein